ncbi:hypothetical protein C8C89_1765 [Janthinobacterium sp. 75]|nr:hypothetical protein C8C89_1765 [Janthinobacterium sp. 75]
MLEMPWEQTPLAQVYISPIMTLASDSIRIIAESLKAFSNIMNLENKLIRKTHKLISKVPSKGILSFHCRLNLLNGADKRKETNYAAYKLGEYIYIVTNINFYSYTGDRIRHIRITTSCSRN